MRNYEGPFCRIFGGSKQDETNLGSLSKFVAIFIAAVQEGAKNEHEKLQIKYTTRRVIVKEGKERETNLNLCNIPSYERYGTWYRLIYTT